MPRSPLAVGARLLLHTDGILIPATSFAWRTSPMLDEIYGLDEWLSQEIAPGIVRVQGSVGLMRRVGDGGSEGQGLGTSAELIPNRRYAEILVLERQTRQRIHTFQNVVFGEQSWSVAAKGVELGSVTWIGEKWGNEVTGEAS